MAISTQNPIAGWGRNCLSYTKACLYGIYQRVTKQPIANLEDWVTTHIQVSAEFPLSETRTIETVDFSKRSYGIFPTVRRAHIISKRELIKAGLQVPREGEFFRSGFHAGFDQLMGVHNMLLHPDHARLRKPLERLFSPHTSQSSESFKKVWKIARDCFKQNQSIKNSAIDSVPAFITATLFKTLLGLRDTKEANDILEQLSKQNETPQADIRKTIAKNLNTIFEKGDFEPGAVLDVLHEDATLTNKEKISTAIMLIFSSTQSSIQFLKL
jgi:hypothetical protein